MESIVLSSINRASSAPLYVSGKLRNTGHFKQPQAGKLLVDHDGIAGDFIGNLKHHGGVDQALYLFSETDNHWWQRLLRAPLHPGYFGENFTLSHWWPSARVGDRLRCGTLLLELTGPRTPCATLEARTGIKGLSREFIRAERSGAYARILQPGWVQAGDRLEVIPASSACPTIVEIFRYWHAKGDDPAFLKAALAAPLASRIAESFRGRLARCQSANFN